MSEKKVPPIISVLAGVLALVVIGGAAGGWYGYREIRALSRQVADLSDSVASTTAKLQGDITETDLTLNKALEDQGKTVADVQQQIGGFQDQVGTLEKLSQLDPQLLAKYSKTYFLNENYVPAQLADIPSQYSYFDDRTMHLIPQVLLKAEAMLTQAKRDGVDLYVFSAYRSFAEQKNLKSAYTVTFGSGANAFSADQGYSEHQLGTTVDFMTTGIGGQLDTAKFEATPAYRWLQDNAYKYGFELSYPKDNPYYIYEPWHWRYVGVKLATDLHNAGKNFYDLDQRTINSYLVSIFD